MQGFYLSENDLPSTSTSTARGWRRPPLVLRVAVRTTWASRFACCCEDNVGLSARGLVGERRALLARPIGANAQLIGTFPRGDLEAHGAAKTVGTGY